MTRTRPLAAREAQTLTLPGARLLVVRGPDRGRAARLEQEETIVGTADSAHLRLTDGTVSRNHLAVRITDGGWLAVDLESTNGTFFGERRVGSVWLQPGDTVDLGATRVRLERTGPSVELPLAGGDRFGGLIGRSIAARRLFALLGQVAASDATVLLTGETGSGKDVAAHALHEASPRREGPFVVFDCGAVAANLVESELFGHERGAFTGAVAARAGALREAAGGTLFLDEIGELPRDLQPKLLRALDRREVRPVGGDRVFPVDVRVIAATHRDLKMDVNRGLFREDLYYRVSVVAIRVPPLRERREDVLLLADVFWRAITRDPDGALPEELRVAFLKHDWPGNVRELRNRVERAAVLVPSEALTDPRKALGETYHQARARVLDEFERNYLPELLVRAHNNVSEAARLGDLDRVHLTRLLRKHRLSPRS